jgi:hypothetical protein
MDAMQRAANFLMEQTMTWFTALLPRIVLIAAVRDKSPRTQ